MVEAPTPADVRIDRVTLAARDVPALARFYVDRLGLRPLTVDNDGATLAVGSTATLQLVRATTAPTTAAGLFHTAFRLPSRAALGRWLAGATAAATPIAAASDHGVSEAFYLSDPEGNGIEVYADRPRTDWPRQGDGYALTTAPMDVAGVRTAGAEAGGPQLALPDAADIGHVHLRVGDLAQASAFFADRLGCRITDRRPGALFLTFTDYHHDVAVNVWGSDGAAARTEGEPGLVEVAWTVTPDRRAALARTLGVPATAALRAVDPTGVAWRWRTAG